jgi:hypothetical protein
MNLPYLHVVLLALAVAGPADENAVFRDLIQKGITMSDGAAVKLRAPILADGLDAAAQRAAINKVADARSPFEELVRKSYYAPVVVKIRTVKSSPGEGPTVRAIDLWFVVHGDWNTLTSQEFLESVIKPKEEGKSRVVSKSGVLTDKELDARKLSVTTRKGYEERFVYSTFSLFERVEVSSTRFAVVASGKNSVLAAGKTDPRFAHDTEYPNQWRPLLRDEQAEIKPGPAHPLAPAGGYAKLTRLKEPADAVLIECHLVYEEPYGWFDGASLVKQKVPLMVQEKVRTFRRKLALAGTSGAERKSKD